MGLSATPFFNTMQFILVLVTACGEIVRDRTNWVVFWFVALNETHKCKKKKINKKKTRKKKIKKKKNKTREQQKLPSDLDSTVVADGQVEVEEQEATDAAASGICGACTL